MTPRTVAALALVLALSATAQAAQLYSPPMFPDSDANLECLIVNVSDVTHAVTITARSINGGDVGGQQVTLGPLQTGFHLDGTQTAVMCHFTVDGGKNDYRAAVCVVVGAHIGGEIGKACLPAN
jgi:hypothetical protein